MKKNNIVLGVVSDQLPFPIDSNWIYDDWSAADPDRFIFGYQIWDPTEISIENLRELIKTNRIKVLGELGFQYSSIPINDPSVEPFFALADEMDIPVHIHLGGLGAGQTFPIQLGNPLLLSEVLQKHPSLRVCVENASFPYLEEIVAVMLKYPNVYAELSTALWIPPKTAIHKHLKGLIDYGLAKRIMFGSDQMQWPEVIAIAIQTIESAGFLNAEQKRDIFYNNAARFLRLSDEQMARHYRK